jgi:hypothetical protein
MWDEMWVSGKENWRRFERAGVWVNERKVSDGGAATVMKEEWSKTSRDACSEIFCGVLKATI